MFDYAFDADGNMGGDEEPFVIVQYDDGWTDLYTRYSGNYTISISTLEQEIIKIDEKYLPDRLIKKTGLMVGNHSEIFNDYENNEATGQYAHAEGYESTAYGNYSHVEGYSSYAHGEGSHAEGIDSQAMGMYSHAEGENTTAHGRASHSEGVGTHAYGKNQHVQGRFNVSDPDTADRYAHIVGNGEHNFAESNAHTLDWDGNAWFAGDVYVGSTSGTNKDEGSKKLSTVGKDTKGTVYTINGTSVTAETGAETFNDYTNNIASGKYSHSEGSGTTASGYTAHAEGEFTTASDEGSHAEGFYTMASGGASHAEGNSTIASGFISHAEGWSTIASGEYQHVQGKFNIEDTENKYAHIIGNGYYDSDNKQSCRSNAYTLDWSGNGWFAGTVEGTGVIIKSSTEGSNKRFKITVDDSGAITATELVE
jgi:hypothetical protein